MSLIILSYQNLKLIEFGDDFCFCQFWICREKLLVVMVKAMKNPRSALCKTSIMTCSDIFGAFGEKLLQQPHLKSMDDLVK